MLRGALARSAGRARGTGPPGRLLRQPRLRGDRSRRTTRTASRTSGCAGSLGRAGDKSGGVARPIPDASWGDATAEKRQGSPANRGNLQPPPTPYPCRVPTLLAPRSWGAHLLMVLAVAAAVVLGLWQLRRVGGGAGGRGARPLERRADAAGEGDGRRRPVPRAVPRPAGVVPGRVAGRGHALRRDRELDGKRGYWVVTPVLVGESAMPVVRGWSAQAEAPAPNGEVEVEGWLQASEGSGAVDDDPHDDVIPEMRIASIVEHVDADLYSGYVVDREPDRRPGRGAARLGPEDVQLDLAAQPALRPPVVGLRRLRDLHLGALVPRHSSSSPAPGTVEEETGSVGAVKGSALRLPGARDRRRHPVVTLVVVADPAEVRARLAERATVGSTLQAAGRRTSTSSSAAHGFFYMVFCFVAVLLSRRAGGACRSPLSPCCGARCPSSASGPSTAHTSGYAASSPSGHRRAP